MKRIKKLRKITGLYSLQDAINKANDVIKVHPELTFDDFELELNTEYCYYESDIPSVCLEYNEEETDAEMKVRLDAEKRRKEQQEKWDRQQYEALKKKFAKGT